MEGYFTGRKILEDYKALLFGDCVMLCNVAHLKTGDKVDRIVVYTDSGDLEMKDSRGRWHRLRQVIPMEQPYNVSYMMSDNGFNIIRVKRRRLNKRRDNLVLIDGTVFSENKAALVIQSAWRTVYMSPDYTGGKKIINKLKETAESIKWEPEKASVPEWYSDVDETDFI
jgi:hypothetical protein